MAVTGIGGIFFRSANPDARAAWYRDHLGINAGSDAAWQQDEGMTVLAPFAADSDYFPPDQPFMFNLRVTNLDDLAHNLEASGICVERRAEWDTSFGRFARIHAPEGLPIELWELPS